MKALCVRQPWAALIAAGRKTIELRTWHVHYRGPFVLCSSAKRIPLAARQRWPDLEMPIGIAVAVCELLDIRAATPADTDAACCEPAAGEYAWLVRVVRALEHTPPVKGKLGLWEYADELLLPATA